MTKPVFAEVDGHGRKVEWFFRYDPAVVRILKDAHGSFTSATNGGPKWSTPLDFDLVRRVGQRIGKDKLALGAALEEWAWRERNREKILRELLKQSDAELSRLDSELPELAATLRPDQRVGIAYCTLVDHPLLADEMGLGKTLEAIGTAYEAGTADGLNLVICPVTSAESVWRYELERWQPAPVYVASSGSAAARSAILDEAVAGGTGWVIVNPAMVRKDKFPILAATRWSTIIADEIADGGARHPETQTAKGLFALKIREGGKRIAMTGTPWGGKPINGWGILHWLMPERFTSKWAWAWQWLDVTHNGYGYEIGGLRPELQEEFDRHLSQFMIARTKADVLPNLPPKQRIDVWCPMTTKQSAQYVKFAKDAELAISGEHLTATSILAEYTRLKQFAGAAQEVKDPERMTLKALPESGKLIQLEDDLVHLGILDRTAQGKLTPGEDQEQQAVVFSQFSEIVDMLYEHFRQIGLPVLKVTGSTNRKGERMELQRSFQAGEARVMFMTTQTGGVSITLDRASNVFIMDEMWDPDKQRQAEDRCHRASRIHQVTIRYYRSLDTVEEYIAQVTAEKQDVNAAIQAGQVQLWKGDGG